MTTGNQMETSANEYILYGNFANHIAHQAHAACDVNQCVGECVAGRERESAKEKKSQFSPKKHRNNEYARRNGEFHKLVSINSWL